MVRNAVDDDLAGEHGLSAQATIHRAPQGFYQALVRVTFPPGVAPDGKTGYLVGGSGRTPEEAMRTLYRVLGVASIPSS